jgi:DNA-binding NtrC family response regulator
MHARASVLVVDDEEIIRALLEHALADYDVRVAASCAEATARLAARRFDVLLTDKNLPDGDAAELCRAARRANPHAVVFVLTGYASSKSAEQLLRLDIDDYMAKPFDLNLLETRLRAAIERRRATRPGAAAPIVEAGRRVLVVEPEGADRVVLARVLVDLGYEVVFGAEALGALAASGPLAGAVLERRACNEAVKAEILRHKVQNPAFRLVVTIEARALNETVASILAGAVGQVPRPIAGEDARAVLTPIFGVSG